jgi:predicted N-acetyltransferase YhbS
MFGNAGRLWRSAGKELTMITIRHERATDASAREALLDAAFGASRFEKTSERLRAGRLPALSFVAVDDGRLVGTLRLWPIVLGRGHTALLLGPLAVAAEHRNRGIGGALTRRAVREARALGHGAVLLVGDAPYYGRFGFNAEMTRELRMPGPYEPERLLALELASGALDGARGAIVAAGERTVRSGRRGRVARKQQATAVPRAA